MRPAFFRVSGLREEKAPVRPAFFYVSGLREEKAPVRPVFPCVSGLREEKVSVRPVFSLCFGSQRRKSAPETRVLWIFMLNMMENEENWVWRGYFCRTDPFWKNASTKVRTESQIKPRK